MIINEAHAYDHIRMRTYDNKRNVHLWSQMERELTIRNEART